MAWPRFVALSGVVCAIGALTLALALSAQQQTPSSSSTPSSPQVSSPAEAAEKKATVTYAQGRLTINAQDQALAWVLQKISDRARVAIITDEAIGDERVSLQFEDIPLEQALRQVLEPYDAFYFYGVDKKGPASSLKAVWIYPRGEGQGLSPVPPEDWASTRDMQGRLRDPDPQVRSRALEALVERTGNQAVNSVVDALGDQDSEVRARALYAALSAGVELPPSYLYQALQDQSANVRFLALESLARDPNIQMIAERALHDPSPHVQHKAREILARLNPTPRAPSPRQSPQNPNQGPR
jgi:hypothetical protein